MDEIFKKYAISEKILQSSDIKYDNILTTHNLITQSNLIIFLDVETTGFPIKKSRHEPYYPYSEINMYDKSRVVQLSWMITNTNGDELVLRDYIIRPDGFKIGASSKIHNITDECAKKYGVPFKVAINQLKKDTINAKY